MHLLDNGTQVATLGAPQAASGTPGYAATGTPGTFAPSIYDPDTFNSQLEEQRQILLALGLTPDRSNNAQVIQAILRVAAGHVQSISATPGSPLTPDNAGLILVNATAASVSITLPAANAANGVPISYRFIRTDSSANAVSIAFHAGDAPLLGGSGPLSIPPLAGLTVRSDGATHWMQEERARGIQVFASSGTFTPAPGVTQVRVRAVGGGGGGGGTSTTTGAQVSAGSGGNGGCYGEGVYTVTPGAGVTVTVGAAGAGGTAGGGTGGNGGTSSFGALLTCPGGHGASGVPANPPPLTQAPPPATNVASGGAINGGEHSGQAGISGTVTNALGGAGGAGPWGGGGSTSGAAGVPATAPGAAGGGGCSIASSAGVAGGDGYGGIVIVEW